MTTANWITIIIAILGVAVTWGQTTTVVAGLREQLRDLKAEFNRSREAQGERLEEMGKDLMEVQTTVKTRHQVVEELSRRHDTQGVPR